MEVPWVDGESLATEIDWESLAREIHRESMNASGNGNEPFLEWLAEKYEMLDRMRDDIVAKKDCDEQSLETLELHMFNERATLCSRNPRTGEKLWLPLWPDDPNRLIHYGLAARGRVLILQELDKMDGQEIEERAAEIVLEQLGRG